MEKYIVVIEKANSNYSAFSPDAWGCIATGKTVEETLSEMRDALQMHFEAIVDDGEEVPQPQGLANHIANGVFKLGEIADEYFITEVEIPVPQHA